jgi:hypothetical protein
MNIPPEIIWSAALALTGFILGTLWGHQGAILKRVTYHDCREMRNHCPEYFRHKSYRR